MRGALFWLMFITIFASGESTSAQQRTVYQLPVRVHAISSNIRPLDTSFTDAKIRGLIRRANKIWRSAGIVWDLQSIERVALPNEERLIAGLRGQVPFSQSELLGTLMSGNREPLVWNVYLVGDLTAILRVPGVYVPVLQSLTTSERDPAGEKDPGRILAHELGHSLTLGHTKCTRIGNLMSPGCAGANRTRLTRDQIRAARTQAALGQPDSRAIPQ